MTKYGQHQKTVKAFLTDAGRRSIQESRSSLLGYLVIAALTSRLRSEPLQKKPSSPMAFMSRRRSRRQFASDTGTIHLVV